MYFSRINVLVSLYSNHIQAYIKKEAQLGKPKPPDDPSCKSSNSIYYDLFESKEVKKANHDENSTEDSNFMVNRGIIQNLHFFAGAFAAYLSDGVRIEIDQMKNTGSTISADCEACLVSILKFYQQYLATQDREMMHFVLFSFKNFHEAIFRVELWTRLTDETRNLYLEILQTLLTSTRPTIQNSWRYYLTYLKALTTIIDSNFYVNDEYTTKVETTKNEKGISVRKSNQGLKPITAMMNTHRRDAICLLFDILQSKSEPLPVTKEACAIIARVLCRDPQIKIREFVQTKIETLSKGRTLTQRKNMTLLTRYVFEHSTFFTSTFTKICFESML